MCRPSVFVAHVLSAVLADASFAADAQQSLRTPVNGKAECEGEVLEQEHGDVVLLQTDFLHMSSDEVMQPHAAGALPAALAVGAAPAEALQPGTADVGPGAYAVGAAAADATQLMADAALVTPDGVAAAAEVSAADAPVRAGDVPVAAHVDDATAAEAAQFTAEAAVAEAIQLSSADAPIDAVDVAAAAQAADATSAEAMQLMADAALVAQSAEEGAAGPSTGAEVGPSALDIVAAARLAERFSLPLECSAGYNWTLAMESANLDGWRGARLRVSHCDGTLLVEEALSTAAAATEALCLPYRFKVEVLAPSGGVDGVKWSLARKGSEYISGGAPHMTDLCTGWEQVAEDVPDMQGAERRWWMYQRAQEGLDQAHRWLFSEGLGRYMAQFRNRRLGKTRLYQAGMNHFATPMGQLR